MVSKQFSIINNSKLDCMVEKIIKDILVTGRDDVVKNIIIEIDAKLKFGTTSHGPGDMRCFVINTIHYEDFSIEMVTIISLDRNLNRSTKSDSEKSRNTSIR